jgi:hypothetical protein
VGEDDDTGGRVGRVSYLGHPGQGYLVEWRHRTQDHKVQVVAGRDLLAVQHDDASGFSSLRRWGSTHPPLGMVRERQEVETLGGGHQV